jgi:F0F1-type ATP synthase membrane subunit b/b'
MGILGQLGQLFLAALPTSIIVVLFYFFLRWSFFTPIEKVLKERKARLAGSRKDAESLRAAAEEKKRVRQDGLRKARAQIFSEQEATRRIALDERSAATQQARSRANEEIQAARTRIAGELEATRGELEAAGKLLAEQIVHAILDRPEAGPGAREVQ